MRQDSDASRLYVAILWLPGSGGCGVSKYHAFAITVSKKSRGLPHNACIVTLHEHQVYARMLMLDDVADRDPINCIRAYSPQLPL